MAEACSNFQDSSPVAVSKSLIVWFLIFSPLYNRKGTIVWNKCFLIQKKTMTLATATHLEAQKVINYIIHWEVNYDKGKGLRIKNEDLKGIKISLAKKKALKGT